MMWKGRTSIKLWHKCNPGHFEFLISQFRATVLIDNLSFNPG